LPTREGRPAKLCNSPVTNHTIDNVQAFEPRPSAAEVAFCPYDRDFQLDNPRLQGLYNEVVANEQAAAWRAEADKVQAVRDQLSADPALVDEMVGLLTRIVDCDRRIDCLHAAAPESEVTHRLRKIEATARGIDIVQSGTGIIENCRLPNLLVGQHGSSQAWPPAPQQNVGLELLSIFPRNGSGDPNEDRFYEMVLDEVAGHYVMRRRPDAPPLAAPPAPPQLAMREQILSEQARRSQAASPADERHRRNSN
jgi:hypothetical protein